MNIPIEARILYMREQLALVLHKRDRLLVHLRDLDIEEARLRRTFEQAFPGEAFGPPPARWDDLSYAEKLTLHFIANHGSIRQVTKMALRYAMESGEVITPNAFHARLSHLKTKGVLNRDYFGWSVADSVHGQATEVPLAPENAETPVLPWDVLERRARAARSRATWNQVRRKARENDDAR